MKLNWFVLDMKFRKRAHRTFLLSEVHPVMEIERRLYICYLMEKKREIRKVDEED